MSILVQFGLNVTTAIKPGTLWWVLREDFRRALLASRQQISHKPMA